jgi:sulfate adenylyltransferase subunit 1
MDLVNYRAEAFEAIVDDFLAFAGWSGIAGARFLPISALEGDMVVDRGDRLGWYDGPTLLQILETAELPASLATAPFRFPVQYVARSTAGQPRGYMGRIESGSIAVGDRIRVLPSGSTSHVRELRTLEGSQRCAGLHAGVTLILSDERDICRGDLIVRDDSAPQPRRALEATICWLSETPLDVRRKYMLRHTTREVRARIDRVDHLWNVVTQELEAAPPALSMNDIARVELTLAQPVFPDRYNDNRATGSFILIDDATNNTVAAGLVV